QRPGPPPADVETDIDATDTGEARTNRERYEVHRSVPRCASCHDQIDGIGMGFEGYDSIGAHRELDNGFPVDATGELVVGDFPGVAFDGAIELSDLLSESSAVLDCTVTNLFRWAHGRSTTLADRCARDELEDAFRASGGDLRELMVQITLMDAFRHRNGGTP
ncbi:MAG: DUF1585 domain-containing protein, partial [Phycisphaerales bacterium]|nr:DUF1585 domain-containing protein [Phycisphaerales bacterium]